MNKALATFILLLTALLHLSAQEPGVTRYGADTTRNAPFVNHFGGAEIYPRLSRNGHILHYPPIVSLDSVHTSVSTPNSAALYGNVIFNGWSPITMRGFDYSETEDFSTFSRQICTGEEGPLSVIIENLGYNQVYYVRSFAANDDGVSYSEKGSFTVAIGPVVIDTLFSDAQTPFSSDIVLDVEANGGAPLSGEISVFSDDSYQNLVARSEVIETSSPTIHRLFEGLIPSTVYYVRAFLSNGLYSDTAYFQLKTLSDLILTIEANVLPSIYLCPEGTSATYRAVLSGTDPNRPLYRYFWTVSEESVPVQDSICSVTFEEAFTYMISVLAIYGEDTLSAVYEQIVNPSSQNASFYVCTNEFLNTADATTTGIASLRWIDEGDNVVATTNSVTLPTGYYTVEGIDGYGCTLRKEVYVGKKRLSCVIADLPGTNESARFEGNVWKIDSISDEDGFWYAVTQIGSRCWLRQNLQTRHLPSTHQDLLRTGLDFTPNMRYPNNKIDYDPYTMPYTGAVYNWCATMDVASAPYNASYNFASQHRGLCPPGWHIPNRNEILEMADTLLKLYCPDITPNPVSVVSSNLVIANNTPIKHMLLRSCYDSYTNPPYSETIYDASNLSIDPTSTIKFWLSTLPPAEMSADALYINNLQEGIKIAVALRNATYLPVRCVRNYAED